MWYQFYIFYLCKIGIGTAVGGSMAQVMDHCVSILVKCDAHTILWYCFEWYISLSVRFNGLCSKWTWYRNVSILNFIRAKVDGNGGDNWSYKMCRKLQSNHHHQQTNIHFYSPDTLPVAQPKALNEKVFWMVSAPKKSAQN